MAALMTIDPSTQAEEAIIDRLAPLVSEGIYVRNRAQSNQQAKAMAQLSVLQVSGSPIATNPRNPTAPLHKSLSFSIIAEFQNQRSHKDAYPFIWKIIGQLHGFRPVGGQLGAIMSGGFSYGNYDQQSKIYQWNLDFTVTVEFKLPRAL